MQTAMMLFNKPKEISYDKCKEDHKNGKKGKVSQKFQSQSDENTNANNQGIIRKNPENIKEKQDGSKQSMLIKLLKNPDGATIEEMSVVTGWQKHSVRGVISGVLKKQMKLFIASKKEERGRVYRIER